MRNSRSSSLFYSFIPPASQCHAGYTGRLCAELDPGPVTATAGNPLLFEPYWLQHGYEAMTVQTPQYRIGYNAWNSPMSARHETFSRSQMEALETQIRAVHRLFNNVLDVDRYHIVIAAGSSPLIPAAMTAIAEHRTVEITAENAYYTGYAGAVNGARSPRDINTPASSNTRVDQLVDPPFKPLFFKRRSW